MSWTKTYTLQFDPTQTGLSLQVQVRDSALTAVGSPTAATEGTGAAAGTYYWTSPALADGLYGYLDWQLVAGSVLQARTAFSSLDARTTSIANDVITAASLATDAVAEIVDAVWDEPLTGATHNVATSSGRRLRQLGTWVAEAGTAQSVGSNYIQLQASASSVDHYYDQQLVTIIGGTLGVGQVRAIVEYIGSTRRAYVEPWTTVPTGAVEYELLAASCEVCHTHGILASATAGTAVLDSTVATDDYFNDQILVIVGGTGTGQSRYIYNYTGSSKTCDVYPDWATTPDNTSLYMIMPISVVQRTVYEVNAHTDTATANLDVAVSTRLADADYTAPDNATIAAIDAKTTNLPSDPADNSQILAAIAGLGGISSASGGAITALPSTTPQKFTLAYQSGYDIYLIIRTLNGAVANVNGTLTTWVGANLDNYAIYMTDQSGDRYTVDVPADLPTGKYQVIYYVGGTAPDLNDTSVANITYTRS